MYVHEFRYQDSVSPAGIPMRKQQVAIIALALWLIIVTAFMFILQQVNLQLFLVLFVMGLLVVVQFMQSYYAHPGYLRYIRYLVAAGIVILGIIVALKVVDILGYEIVLR